MWWFYTQRRRGLSLRHHAKGTMSEMKNGSSKVSRDTNQRDPSLKGCLKDKSSPEKSHCKPTVCGSKGSVYRSSVRVYATIDFSVLLLDSGAQNYAPPSKKRRLGSMTVGDTFMETSVKHWKSPNQVFFFFWTVLFVRCWKQHNSFL